MLHTQKGNFNIGKIDLLLAGSPCQGFSLAGKQLAFNDERSKLYFEFERIKNQVNPPNFLLENVRMRTEYKDIISNRLGVEPVAINSDKVSAQNRYRLYWSNLSITQPADKHRYLVDVLEDKVDDKYLIKGGRLRWLQEFGEVKDKAGYVAFNPVKGKCLMVRSEPSWGTTYIVQWPQGKVPAMTTSGWGANNPYLAEGLVRRLTPVECERLQTVPDNYTACVSDPQRYKMLGNGWTVDVIAHILGGIK